MKVNVDVWVYKITKCGYYLTPNARTNTPAEFGNVSQILGSLQDWTQDSSMENTCTYACENSDVTATYLLDIQKNKIGDYFLSLWNRITSDGQNVSYINSQSQVGKAIIEKGSSPKNGIPGVASYFWFLPSKGYLCIVKINKSKPKKANFEKYFFEFIRTVNPKHIDAEETKKGEFFINGYKKNEDDEPKNLHPSFTLDCMENTKTIEFIKDNREHITNIELKSKIRHTDDINKNLIQRAVQKVRIGTSEDIHVETIHVKMDIPFEPSEKQLEDVISAWKEEANKQEGNPDKIGFRFNNHGSIWYLHDTLARKEFELDIESKGDYFDATSTLKALSTIRDDILEMLKP